MKPLISLSEAQARLRDLARPTETEAVNCEEALGRYLATPLIAERTQPSADLSAMDGYAVSGDGPWSLVGESRCGAPFGGTIASGEATRISTGAHLPEGADAIVLIEDAQLDSDERLMSGDEVVPGRDIRRVGADFTEGAELLGVGTRLGAAQVALAHMAGLTDVIVHKAAKLAILECGDELVENPGDCAVHQIPASNGVMLAAMATTEQVEITRPSPVADDLDALSAAIDGCSDHDMIVVSGGASVGDHDLVRPALQSLGAEIDFWRVAIKPGKPLMVVTRGHQLILGLPGNPVSSFVTGFLFMLPALRTMLGAAASIPQAIDLPCSEALPEGGPRRTFLRAILADGKLTPIAQQSSGALGALAQANALIERPEHCDATKAGSCVPAYLLGNGGLA